MRLSEARRIVEAAAETSEIPPGGGEILDRIVTKNLKRHLGVDLTLVDSMHPAGTVYIAKLNTARGSGAVSATGRRVHGAPEYDYQLNVLHTSGRWSVTLHSSSWRTDVAKGTGATVAKALRALKLDPQYAAVDGKIVGAGAQRRRRTRYEGRVEFDRETDYSTIGAAPRVLWTKEFDDREEALAATRKETLRQAGRLRPRVKVGGRVVGPEGLVAHVDHRGRTHRG